MARRADWKLLLQLKNISLKNQYLEKIPLFLISKHTSLDIKIDKEFNNIRNNLSDKNSITEIADNKTFISKPNQAAIDMIFFVLNEFPEKHFLLLDKKHYTKSKDKTEFDNEYWDIKIQKSSILINKIEPYLFNSNSSIAVELNSQGVTNIRILKNGVPIEFKSISTTQDAIIQKDITALSSRVTTLIMRLAATLTVCEQENKYLFYVKGVSKTLPPKIKNNPGTILEDLVSIVFLNRIPNFKTKNISKGGTHASPRPHKRKGYFYTLSNIRYSHHPLYKQLKAMYKKPVYVGDKEKVVNGITYTLI